MTQCDTLTLAQTLHRPSMSSVGEGAVPSSASGFDPDASLLFAAEQIVVPPLLPAIAKEWVTVGGRRFTPEVWAALVACGCCWHVPLSAAAGAHRGCTSLQACHACRRLAPCHDLPALPSPSAQEVMRLNPPDIVAFSAQ